MKYYVYNLQRRCSFTIASHLGFFFLISKFDLIFVKVYLKKVEDKPKEYFFIFLGMILQNKNSKEELKIFKFLFLLYKY